MTMALVQTVTVGSGGTASIEFTTIPQDATDLLLVVSARSAIASINDFFLLDLNNGATNPTGRDLSISNNSKFSASRTNGYSGELPGANATSNTFGSMTIYISNYANTSATKSISHNTTRENNSADAYLGIIASNWGVTSAISTVTLTSGNGANFAQYSTASLYKITKA